MDKSKHRKFLAKLGTIIGEKSKAARLITSHAKLKEADRISSHFFSYFETVIANSEELREKVFRIRHEVYCEELNFEPVKESCLESDEFDRYSLHCLIQQRSSKHSAGVVRMVRPVSSNQLLPIEKYCLNSITRKELDPSQFSREHICEISRLAIPKNFRRRALDDFNGAGVGAINQ